MITIKQLSFFVEKISLKKALPASYDLPEIIQVGALTLSHKMT
jgi:hypothetical protein